MKCFQIELTRWYGMNEFHEDLKRLLMQAGGEGKPTVFLFTDTQIINESSLRTSTTYLTPERSPICCFCLAEIPNPHKHKLKHTYAHTHMHTQLKANMLQISTQYECYCSSWHMFCHTRVILLYIHTYIHTYAPVQQLTYTQSKLYISVRTSVRIDRR